MMRPYTGDKSWGILVDKIDSTFKNSYLQGFIMKNIILFSSLALLVGCASLKDGQMQDVTILTPGAENAKCHIQNEDFKYVAYTDQTIEIMKSPHDFTVNCIAAGNREQTVLVKRDVNDWVVANVANGFVPGAAYDYFSGGAFTYPDKITVSFVGQPIKTYGLPEHYNTDLKHNTTNNVLEDMGPDVKLTQENRNDVSQPLQKKQSVRDFNNRSLNSVVNDASVSRDDPFAKGR